MDSNTRRILAASLAESFRKHEITTEAYMEALDDLGVNEIATVSIVAKRVYANDKYAGTEDITLSYINGMMRLTIDSGSVKKYWTIPVAMWRNLNTVVPVAED